MPQPEKDIPQVTPRQLTLFDGFFDEDKLQSRTLDVYDALPKFSLSRMRASADGENLRVFNNVKIGEQVVQVVIAAAAIVPVKKEPGAKAGVPVKGRLVFPGVREELVERALRKMAVQYQGATSLEETPKSGWRVSFAFSLSQLRAELAGSGHGFKLAELREALDVLGRSLLAIEAYEDGIIKNFPPQPIMLIASHCVPGDQTGDRSYYGAVFHPLAARAILEGAWQPVNYARVMKLGLPLARWIATRMNNRFRSAEKCAAFKGKGYFLTLSRILSESGLIPEKRVRNTIARVREALKELRAEGFLDRMKAYDEEISYEGTKRRSEVQDVTWTLYPSNQFVEEIIEGNAQVRKLKSAADKKDAESQG